MSSVFFLWYNLSSSLQGLVEPGTLQVIFPMGTLIIARTGFQRIPSTREKKLRYLFTVPFYLKCLVLDRKLNVILSLKTNMGGFLFSMAGVKDPFHTTLFLNHEDHHFRTLGLSWRQKT